MLVLDIESKDPKDRALMGFFALAHSVDAAIEGWQLALWCPKGPPDALSSHVTGKQAKSDASKGSMAAFGWPRQGRAKNCVVPIDDGFDASKLIQPEQQVVLARRELPENIQGVLRRTLSYKPDLEKQILGWWYGLDDELPDQKPPWRPTASLLPEGGGDLQEGKRCLVLIDVNDCWLVLSERALRTYTFGDRLAEGESVRFQTKVEAVPNRPRADSDSRSSAGSPQCMLSSRARSRR